MVARDQTAWARGTRGGETPACDMSVANRAAARCAPPIAKCIRAAIPSRRHLPGGRWRITQVVADTAAFQSPCNLYDVFANVVNGGSPPVVRDVGPTGFAAPVIATNQLPNLPSFTAGTTTVTVSSNTTLNRAPGSYGGVSVQDDGTLNLVAGTYIVAFLHGGKRAHINTTDTTVVLAAQDISTNNDAVIAPSCLAQFSARSDSVGSNNFTVSFSRNTEAHGQFFAPNGQLNLGDSTDLFGRFVAKSIGSGWNTNVTYCGTGSPITTPTLVPTSTAPPTVTPTNTPVPPPSNTATGGPTSVPTVPATSTAPPPLTATVTAVPTDTPSPTCTPTATLTATSTPTSTPIPPGVIIGEVYDDGSAQPLADVIAQLTSTNTSTTTDPTGAYTLPAAGEQAVALTRSGYTRNLRRLSVPPGRGGQLLDGRLTALAAPVTIDGNGGTVRTAYKAPGSPAADVTLNIPSAALTAPAAVQLTVLSPQGLIAPLPLGWSVLLGVDLQATSTIANTITLHIPASLLALSGSLPVLAAVWEDATQQWLGGPAVVQVGNALEIPIRQLSAVSQIALIVADTDPAAPPAAVEGQPIGGVSALAAAGDSGVVIADPPAIVAGTGASAQVLTQVHGLEPLSSGTVLNAALRETYDLRDGRSLTGTVADEDIIAYQLSPSTSTNTSTTLSAYFNLIPSRNYTLSELSAGRVDIDLSLHVAGGDLGVVGPSGGTIDGSGGLHLVVPPNAVGQTTVIRLHPAPPARLPVGVSGRPDLAGTFEIDVNGGALDPDAAYQIDLGTVVNDGDWFAITRLEQDGQGSVLVLIGFGHGANGRIVFDACAPGVTLCLDGLAGNATYAVFTAPAGAAEVTGTVRDSTGPRAGVRVQSATSPVVSITDAAGQYVLMVPDGVTTTLTALDPVRDTSGQVTVTPVGSTPIFTADIFLTPTVPQVTGIDPANHGSQVALGATITLTFSEAIAAASITDVSVTLTQVGSQQPVLSNVEGSTVESRKSLSTDGTHLLLTPVTPLVSNTIYRVSLTAQVTNRVGTALAPFTSDFTTAEIFQATALPPNTLRVSLPDDQGRVFVCGGANLAAPGTDVVVLNDATDLTRGVTATDRDGVSASEECEFIAAFQGRCNTDAPGTFCMVIQANLGDKIAVQVQDVLGNPVMLDAGNMKDERTGSTAVGPDGGRIVAVQDARFSAQVAPGAFDGVHVVTVIPIRDDEFPVPIGADAGIHHQGAVFLDLGGEDVVAREEIGLTIAAPPGFDPGAQILVGQVINFRGRDELTLVDNGSYRVNEGGESVLSTNSPPFPGPRRSGYYEFSTPDRSVGYVLGVVDKHLSTADVIPSALSFVFPYLEPVLTKFAMPVLADEPGTVSLQNVNGQVLAQVDIVGPPAGQFLTLPAPLSDDPTPVAVDGISVPNGETGVDTQHELVLTFSRAVKAGSDGRLPVGAIEVRDANGRLIAGTWAIISPDGRQVRFFRLRPFPPGQVIGVTVTHVEDTGGHIFAGFSSTFETFGPTVAASVPVSANDIDLLQLPLSSGTAQPVAVVARNGDATNDNLGGIVSIDVRNAHAPVVLGEALTEGVDRAVRVVAGTPLVLGVDSAGNRQRFGTIRAFNLSNPGAPVEVGRRVLNLSPQTITEQIFLADIPADGGVPLSIALVGTDAAYVANPPVIGIQQVTISRMIPPRNEIEGLLNGEFFAVAALRQFVLAAGRHDGVVQLIVLDPTLTSVRDHFPLHVMPLEITTIPSYPVDLDGDGNLGIAEDQDGDPTTSADEAADLVVVQCDAGTLCILRLDASGAIVASSRVALPGALGSPRGGAVDPQRRLLYLAAGTAGLAVVDFNDPLQLASASDPVLDVVPLSGQAKRCASTRTRGVSSTRS